MAKSPAVLWYSSDFLTGTMFMTDEEVGKYTKLLCAQQQHVTNEIDKEAFNNVVGSKKRIREKFIETETGFYNQRMRDECIKRKLYCESRQTNRKSTYVEHMENENEIENKKKKREELLRKREEEFRMLVFKEGEGKYTNDMKSKFCDYWTERNKSETKMRYELQPVFEIRRRLVTWANRDRQIVSGKKEDVSKASFKYKHDK